MQPPADAHGRHGSTGPTTLDSMHDYRERLYAPLAWWLLAVPTVLLLGATLYAGLRWPWPLIIIGGLAAGCATILITLGWATVEVDGGMLRAGNAALPVTAISKVLTLDEKQTTRLRGPQADPSARLYSRPYLKQSVYLAIDATAWPGAAPPGHWLVGTRHPAQLADAIERSRVQAGREPVA
jgi:hypothetical protein